MREVNISTILNSGRSDFSFSTTVFRVIGSIPTEVVVTLIQDNIAQESDETFQLRLSLFGSVPNDVFFLDTITIVIRDQDGA